jgi:hypothetical protein
MPLELINATVALGFLGVLAVIGDIVVHHRG